MTQKSNSRRFVNAAWALLTFQFIASAGAVAVTGWAAFDVHRRLVEIQRAELRAEPAIPARGADGEEAERQKTQEEPETPPPPPLEQAQVAPRCERYENSYRVHANLGWCDTGLVLQQGQQVQLSISGRGWSNAGEPQYGPAGIQGYRHPGTIVAEADLASLIGRVGDAAFPIGAASGFTSPTVGPLYLSINDTPGTFEDNQGYLDVRLDVPIIIQ